MTLNKAFVGWPTEGPLDLADVLMTLWQRGLLAGYEVDRRFYEIGSPQGYAELSAHLAGASV